jgi:hypothetical protein
MRGAAVLVVLVVCAGAGCGGGDDGDEGTAAGRSIKAEAQERAESIVLKLSDFPDGWRASPSEQDTAAQEDFRRCVGLDYSEWTLHGAAESKDFAKESAEVSSAASVFASEAQAQAALSEFENGMGTTQAEDCVRDLMEQALKEEENADEFEVGEIDVGQLSITGPAVEDTSAWQIAVRFDVTSGVAEGLSPTAYLDLVNLRDGEALTIMTTSDVLTPFDSELRDELLQTLASRMSE